MSNSLKVNLRFVADSALTSSMLRRLVSHRFRHPISVDMYHPLKAVAVNWMPPQSNSIPDTAGSAYQRRFRSANHLNVGWLNGTSMIRSGGKSK